MQTNSRGDEILKNQKEAEEKQKKVVEDLKLVSKELFSTINGKFFLKYLKRLCLWDEQDLNINNEILIYKKGRRDIWTIIRNIIPKDILAQIEIFDDNELQK
jgi:hypothetical protein